MNARDDVLGALRLMGKLSDVIQDTHGNVSQRDGDRLWIKPSGMDYMLIGIDDVCEVLIDRPTGKNKRSPSVDTVHHAKIYKNHRWIGGICHTHSPYAVAYAAMGENLYPYTTEHADFFGNTVFCKKYERFDRWGSISIEEGTKAVLLQNHGVLTFGKDAKEAVKLAAALENIARKNYLLETRVKSPSLRKAMRLPIHEVNKWHERYNNVYGQKDSSDS